jgi:hypothetical protein
LLVATDLHGNLEDYEALKAIYYQEKAAGGEPLLLFCGDMVHGPSPDLLKEGAWPDFLGDLYEDRSADLLRDYMRFAADEQTLCLLGNHEHAHIGGPRLQKFHEDEAAVLNDALGVDLPVAMAFWRRFPLIAIAPCGAVFCHASPRACEADLAAFERLSYAGFEDCALNEMHLQGSVGALLWSRSATDAQAKRLLTITSPPPERHAFVVFGHEVIDEGYEISGAYQLCLSTSFGLYREKKTYLRLDLSQRYRSVHDLREGIELCKLYP